MRNKRITQLAGNGGTTLLGRPEKIGGVGVMREGVKNVFDSFGSAFAMLYQLTPDQKRQAIWTAKGILSHLEHPPGTAVAAGAGGLTLGGAIPGKRGRKPGTKVHRRRRRVSQQQVPVEQ